MRAKIKKKKNLIFIAGTDTGVGKTILSGCLARYLSGKGKKVITQKWIQTGSDSIFSSDIKVHLELMGLRFKDVEKYSAHLLPYAFKIPASAHLAAKLENKSINPDKIKKSLVFLAGEFDFVLVEGLGGALVPFSEKGLVIDLVKELDIPVLIVARNQLGSINHTLLTIEALTARKIRVLGLVFNNTAGERRVILEDNPRIIKKLSGQRVFGTLARHPSYEKIYEEFRPIGRKITEAILHDG